MKRKIVLYVIATFLLMVACKPESNSVATTGTVYGMVIDRESGVCVSNASVTIKELGITTVTGSDGQYEFNELPLSNGGYDEYGNPISLGGYEVFANKSGYGYGINDVKVLAGKKVKCDIVLDEPACIYGTVYDHYSNPIPMFDVRIDGLVSVLTGMGGTYEINEIPTTVSGREYTVVAYKGGFGTLTKKITLFPGQRMQLDFYHY